MDKVVRRTPLSKRACDTCRIRKVKCDKASPCAACKAANVPCHTSPIGPRVPKKRVLVSEEYEKKIDQIQSRLSDLDHALKPDTGRSKWDYQPPKLSSPVESGNQERRSYSSATPQPLPAATVEEEIREFEGESSLQAYSDYAREVLEKAVNARSYTASSPEMASAIHSLRQLSSGPDTPAAQKQPARSDGRIDLLSLPLPPTDAVLEILRRMKDRPQSLFIFPSSSCYTPNFTELCKSVFFCVEPYSTSTAILVHGTLYYLFLEFALTETNEAEKARLEHYSTLCKTNLEISLANLEFFLPATADNVAALALGISYSTDISKSNMSWKLSVVASSMAQSLGWHRKDAHANDTEEERRRKGLLFWLIYLFNKNLSLRLGRASTLQDCDIDAELPRFGEGQYEETCSKYLLVWVTISRIHGQIYEQLYSPAALNQSDSVRKDRANVLLREMDAIQETYKEASVSSVELGLAGPGTLNDRRTLSFVSLSDEVIMHLSWTMIYRAMPAEESEVCGLSSKCLESARSSLAIHFKAAEEFRGMGSLLWSLYLAWTIHHVPFAPFIVLFCNILSTSNVDDLELLEKFVSTLSSPGDSNTEATVKLHQLCSSLYNVAKSYVEAEHKEIQRRSQMNSPESALSQQEQGQGQQQHQQLQLQHHHQQQQQQQQMGSPHPMNPDRQTPVPQGQAWAPLNPYLNALGFQGDPALDANATMNQNLGDWFNGNQYVMGLLENDMSYFNTDEIL